MIVAALALSCLGHGAPDELEPRLYRAQMAAAESAIRLGDFAAARAWLDETRDSARGFEWRVLDAGLDESLSSYADPQAYAYSIDASRDGATLLCGFSDGRVELRAVDGGALVRALGKHAESVTYARFSPDGARAVTTSFDRTVKLWDVATGALLVDFKGHGYPVGGAAFSPDGSLVASCSYERPPGTVVGTVHVWNAADGAIVRTFEGGRKPLIGIEFSPDGERVAAGSWDFCVFVWDLAGGEPRKLAVPDEGIYNAVDACAWSPDGKLVAGASKDKTARVWNAETGELVATLRAHTDYVSDVVFSPDGALVATSSSDATVRLWNTADWSARAVLRGHAGPIECARFLGGGERLVSAGQDRTLRTWDARTSWYGGVRLHASHAAYTGRFSPDDRRLATCSFDGRAQIWSTATWELLAAWQAHPEDKSCHMLDWSPDGRWLATGSYDQTVKLWDADTLEELARFEHPGGLYWMRVAPDGRTLAASCGTSAFVWDVAARARKHELKGHAKSLMSLTYSPDSKRLVTCARDGKAVMWDVESGEKAFEIPCEDADVAEAVFTPDGASLAVAERGGRIRLCSASDGATIRELRRDGHGLDHLDLSPDGTRLAIAADTVTLIDVAVGRSLGHLRPHVDAPFHVDFDSRGTRLASVSTDKSIAIADVEPLRVRLARRDAALAARPRAQDRVRVLLAREASLRDVARILREDRSLGDAEREAHLDLVLVEAGRR